MQKVCVQVHKLLGSFSGVENEGGGCGEESKQANACAVALTCIWFHCYRVQRDHSRVFHDVVSEFVDSMIQHVSSTNHLGRGWKLERERECVCV